MEINPYSLLKGRVARLQRLRELDAPDQVVEIECELVREAAEWVIDLDKFEREWGLKNAEG